MLESPPALALGLRGDASVEYIQSYRGTPDTLDASLDRRSRVGQFAMACIVACKLFIAISWIFAWDD